MSEGKEGEREPHDYVEIKGDHLHVLGRPVDGAEVPFAYLATKKSFSNYRLKLGFRWGQKRFAPRALDKRDSGLLFHVHGRQIVWPDSVEFQIQEGDVGDAFTIDTQVSSTIRPGSFDPDPRMPSAVFDHKGLPHTQGQDGTTRVTKASDAERPQWNELELVVCGDAAWFFVNGVRVNHLRALRTWRPGPSGQETWVRLDAGRIALQAEGAEVFFREITLTPLAAFEGIACR